MAHALDLGVACWSPLASGVLSGKYAQAQGAPAGGRLEDATFAEVSDTTAGTDAGDVVAEPAAVAAEPGCEPAQAALASLCARPGVVIPIAGARRVDQMVANLRAAEITLTAEQQERLAHASRFELGFPHDFLATETRRYGTSGHYDRIDNHHAHGYAEHAVAN